MTNPASHPKPSRIHHTATPDGSTGDFGIDRANLSSHQNSGSSDDLTNTQSVNCVLYSRHTGKLVTSVALEAVQEQLAKHDDYFVWIYLLKPSNEVLVTIQHDFELHDLAIEDTTVALQRTKIELYGDKLFVVFGTVSHNESLQGIELGSSNN